MKCWFCVLFAALVLSSLTCMPQVDEMVPLRAAIEKYRQALSTGDAQTVAELWAWDAIFMPQDGEIVQGKERVAELWTKNIQAGFRTKEPVTLELERSGDMACEFATQLWTMKRGGVPQEWKASKFVHVWNKQSDGSWKLHLDIWNASPSPS
jgi:uncharacterized protein (TIGR02246 family)